MASGEKLRVGTKLGFGVGSVADGAILIAFNTWNMLFYNQVLGLSGTLAGLAVTISLILDAIADPIVGSISDRWHSKLGRRHPFLFAAPLPLAASFYLLYAPPSGLGDFGLFLWFTLFATLHRQALTVYQVPHLALGAELSTDYHQRSVVMSYATLFTVVGGAGTFFFGWTWFSKAGGTSVQSAYPMLGLFVGVTAALAIFISAWTTRDQVPRLVQPTAAASRERVTLGSMFREIRDCVANYNYRMLLLGLFCASLSIGTRETLNSYSSLFFWELPPDRIRVFGLASPFGFVLAFFVTVWLHRRFDKRRTIIISLCLTTFANAAPVLFRVAGIMPPNGSPKLVPVLFLFVFLFYLGTAVLLISALSALADVADEHELNTGQRQEGVFYAARVFFGKLSSAAGHVIAGIALDVIQFPKGAKVGEVAHDTVLAIGLLDGPIGAIPTLVAIYFYAAYRIDKKRHAEIAAALLEKRKRTAADNPANPAVPAPVPGAEPAPF